AEPSTTSRDWISAMLAHGEPGTCHLKSPMYHWRNVGWGSNMNQILKRWVGSIIGGQQDCSLDVTQACIQQIRCPSGPTGAARDVTGWHCMFKPMSRLCTFQASSVSRTSRRSGPLHRMSESPRLPLEMRERRLTLFITPTPTAVTTLPRALPTAIHPNSFLARQALQDHEIARENYASNSTLKIPLPGPHDTAAVASAVLDFMYSHAQPWFQNDIQAILREDNISSLRQEKFVAIHVRRGDKLRREASRVEVWVYLEAAALHIWQTSGDRSGVNSVSGVWVSSDDSSVLADVQELAPSYFPNVQKDKIITISFRDNGPGHPNETPDELSTKAHEMTYELYVGLHAELEMMATADVFVGTFSSNIARFVYVMRESNGLPRSSTVSVDEPRWNLH
ncbi:unnamed protein product, partial [Hapterophycus canaliculatus]